MNESFVKQEKQILSQLIDFIQSNNFKVGCRLPSERKLSKILNTSRTTLRSAINILEVKGIVEVRKSSGCYLLKKNELCEKYKNLQSVDMTTELQDQIEARYIFEPKIAVLATKRITKKDLNELEQCLIRFSRSIINKNLENILTEEQKFREIIACTTGNKLLACMIEKFKPAIYINTDILVKLDENEWNTIFANYTALFRALKEKKSDLVSTLTEKIIKNTYRLI